MSRSRTASRTSDRGGRGPVAGAVGFVSVLLLRLGLAFEPDGRFVNAFAVIGLVIGWYLLPYDACLLRRDLVPWTALCTAVVCGLQGGRLASGPHPQLPERSTVTGALALRVASASVPFLLAAVYELGAFWSRSDPVWPLHTCNDRVWPVVDDLAPKLDLVAWPPVLHCLVLIGAVVVCMAIGAQEGRTAWRPTPTGRTVRSFLRAAYALLWPAGLFLMGLFAGRLAHWASTAFGARQGLVGRAIETMATAPAVALVAGGSFVACGMVWDRTQNLDQAVATMQHADLANRTLPGRPWWERYAVAGLLPSAGALLVVFPVGTLLASERSASAFAVAVFLTAIGVVVWPARRVVGRVLILHQVEAVGQAEPSRDPGGGADISPPVHTLVFDPQRVRRNGISIPWVVPAQDAIGLTRRLGREPLWFDLPSPPLRHVLGQARLPGAHGGALSDRVEITLRSSLTDALDVRDVVPLAPGDNQDRRLLIYTPSPQPDAPGAGGGRRGGTSGRAYVQDIDPSVDRAILIDGSVIVISAGMVTYMYEVEFGAILADGDPPPTDTLPQLQDFEVP